MSINKKQAIETLCSKKIPIEERMSIWNTHARHFTESELSEVCKGSSAFIRECVDREIKRRNKQ